MLQLTSDPQRNIDFYTGNLGLQFVKLTVNQDDSTSYHLYYGDELGHPGTILSFIDQTYLKDMREQARYLQYLF